jgi:tetratricopeptide (TPR) repeat protein
LVSEYDQLCAKLNDPLAQRLEFLQRHIGRVLQRDDCTVALASLYNLTGQPATALDVLTNRRFHPWEGGEGSVLRQFTTARILLGKQALAADDAAAALTHFTGAMETPANLGEAYHLFQAKADVNYWIGMAHKSLENSQEAAHHFHASATEAGDFAEMAVIAHSPLSYYRGLSLRELGRDDEARVLFEDLRKHGERQLLESARIDYFATSLPNLLVFEEDLQARRAAESHLLIAMAYHGLGDVAAAREALAKVMSFTNADQHAINLKLELDL